MALDPRYIVAPSLEEYFVDKDTGLPLAGGIVTFYSDVNRTQLKTVYRLSGTAPNYTYTPIDNPMTLSSVGTAQDGGDNIIVYFFPFNDAGEVELYYITVDSALGVRQFTREGWPNVADTSGEEENLLNFIPNGQFLAHNNIPATSTTPANRVNSTLTELAQGGWYFDRPSNNATDNITFPRYNSISDSPVGNPRYSIKVVNQVPAMGDAYKRLEVRFNNVNMFASATQTYTFAFSAISTGSVQVQLQKIKYFGVGGSSQDVTALATKTITSDGYHIFQTSFIFGTNTSETIGLNNDDYVALAINFPVNSAFDVNLTDFILTPGEINFSSFPYKTDREVLSDALTPIRPPNPNGSDLFLPLVVTKEGIGYDDSGIAKVYASLEPFFNDVDHPNYPFSETTNEAVCQGEQLLSDGYSNLGIPFRRLRDKIGTNYGTGKNFVNSYIRQTATNEFIMMTNQFGTATAPADGTPTTGFAFASICSPSSTGYDLNAYSAANGDTVFAIATKAQFVSAAPTAGTSAFTLTTYANPAINPPTYLIFIIQCVSAASITGGDYFTFSTYNGSIEKDYYVWFTKDGVGADPAPGGTGIQVNIFTGWTENDVMNVLVPALGGRRVEKITMGAASTLNGGGNFTFSGTNNNNYYVWYKKDGVGTDPAIVGATGIEVDILGTDTAAQVAVKTFIEIDDLYFALPDFQGLFLRGLDPSKVYDIDSRFGVAPGIYGEGDEPYSFQLYQVQSHTHSFINWTTSAVTPTGSPAATTTINDTTGATGGTESRPVNANVIWVIKY